jgi:hypothetical protein
MPLEYKCPKCDNEWTHTGNTCTTFRDGGVQTWNGAKDHRIDICTCGAQGTHTNKGVSNAKISFTDRGTGKSYTR